MIHKEETENETNSALKKIAKGGGLVFIAMLLGKVFNFLYVLILSRLGPEKYGYLSLGFTILEFLLMFSTIGLREGTVRYVSFYLGKNDKARIKGAIVDPIKWVLFLSICFSFAIYIFSPQISILFNEPLLINILRGLSLALPFWAVGSILILAIIGFKKGQYASAIRDVINPGLDVLLTAILLFMGYGIFGVIFSYIVNVIILFLLAFYFLDKKTFSIISAEVKTKHYFKKIFSYSWPLAIFTILWIVMGKINIIMLGLLKTTEVVGIYNVALPTAALLMMIPLALTTLFFPVITETYAKKQDFKKIFKVVNKWTFFIIFPLFLIMVLFSKQILTIIFKNNYVLGWSALSTLAFGYMILGLCYNNLNVLQMLEKTKLILSITLVATLVNIILSYLLIIKYSMLGAAIATATAHILIAVLSSFYVFKYTRLIPIKKVYWKGILAAIIPFLLVYIVKELIDANKFIVVASLAIIFLAIFILMMKLLKAYEKEDIVILDAIAKKFKLNFLNKL